MTIYAKQIAPEYQESPLMYDEEFLPYDVSICGNRHYNGFKSKLFAKVEKVIEQNELAEMLQDNYYLEPYYKNITAAIMDYLPPQHKEKYSTQEIHKLKELLTDYEINEETQLCGILSIVSGKEIVHDIIRGCSQGEWNIIYYPEKYGPKFVNTIECEYFNTGSEWIIHDEEYTPEDPEEISGYGMYCHEWREEDILQEIAEVTGENPKNIVLYYFDGYTRTPKYKRMEA